MPSFTLMLCYLNKYLHFLFKTFFLIYLLQFKEEENKKI